jgi:hypothetical protein
MGKAFSNGSLYSFNSLLQFMLAIIAMFGIFIVRIRGKYSVVDVFPWLGHPKADRELYKQYGKEWWRYARIISDKKATIEQREIVILFQRCLRISSAAGWKETLVTQLIRCEERWFNRPRNNIVYNFTGWTDTPDLLAAVDVDVSALLRSAARSIFDYEAQRAFGSLPQSLLLGSMLAKIWSGFREVVVMELEGKPAPYLPAVGDMSLIGEFENALNELLSDAAWPS